MRVTKPGVLHILVFFFQRKGNLWNKKKGYDARKRERGEGTDVQPGARNTCRVTYPTLTTHSGKVDNPRKIYDVALTCRCRRKKKDKKKRELFSSVLCFLFPRMKKGDDWDKFARGQNRLNCSKRKRKTSALAFSVDSRLTKKKRRKGKGKESNDTTLNTENALPVRPRIHQKTTLRTHFKGKWRTR